MDDLLAGLRAEYRSQTDRAARLLDQAKAEKRDLTESEAGQYEAATAELRTLSERIAITEQRVDRDRELDGFRSKSQAFISPETRGDFRDPMDDAGLHAFFTERRGKPGSIDVSFKGLEVTRNAQGRNEVRSLLESGGSSALQPISFRTVLYEHLILNSAIRSVATVITSTSGEKLILPKTTAHPASGTIVAEGALLNESDPTFGQGTLVSYKYGNLIEISTETEEDTQVDLRGYVARAMGRALGIGSGAHMVTGTGTGQPQGVLVGAGTIAQVVGGTPAANGATYAELVHTFDSIIPPYQTNGSWFMGQSALSKLRGLVNTVGTPLFVESLAASPGTELFGRPCVIDPAMPSVGIGGTSIAWGDFATYFIRDVSLRLERSIDYAFGNDLVAYRALLRSDGRLLDLTGSIATYVGGTS